MKAYKPKMTTLFAITLTMLFLLSACDQSKNEQPGATSPTESTAISDPSPETPDEIGTIPIKLWFYEETNSHEYDDEENYSFIEVNISKENFLEEAVAAMNQYQEFNIHSIWYEGHRIFADLSLADTARMNSGSANGAIRTYQLLRTLASFPDVAEIEVWEEGRKDPWRDHFSFEGYFTIEGPLLKDIKRVFDSTGGSADSAAVPADFNFNLSFGIYGKNNINTYGNTFTKDLVLNGLETIDFYISEEKKIDIYNAFVEYKIYELPANINAEAELSIGDSIMIRHPAAQYTLTYTLNNAERPQRNTPITI